MKEIITIYVLVDPLTLKVRYIGRTKCSLQKRLREHYCKSKKNAKNNHKANWINKLRTLEVKPIIRKLTIVEGWAESYIVEKCLINKYKERLLNHDDRGEGGINKIITKEQKVDISNGLKRYFELNRDNLSYCKKIYVYTANGEFYNEYPSIKNAARQIGFPYTAIHKYFRSVYKKPYRKLWQFSYTKVEKMQNFVNVN